MALLMSRSSDGSDVTIYLDSFSYVLIVVYFVILAQKGPHGFEKAQLFFSRFVQPNAGMSENARAAFESGRLRAFRAFNSVSIAGMALLRAASLAKRVAYPNDYSHEVLSWPWLFTGIVFEIFPRALTVGRYEMLFIVATSASACERVMGVTYLPTFEVAYIIFRLATSMVVCNPRLAVGMNAVITVGSLYNHVAVNPQSMYGTIVSAASSEINIFVATTALSFSAHFCAVQGALLHSELQTAQTPLRSLLARWCDATVELGSDLRMRQDSVSLAALLLQPSRRLQGTLFEDLLHRDDRPRFAQVVASCTAMESPAAHASPAQVLQVSLLDGHVKPVPVQLVHTCISNGKAEYRHFIGIREEDAEFHALPPPPVAELELTHQSWEQAIRSRQSGEQSIMGAPDVEVRVTGGVSDDGSQPLGTNASGQRSIPVTVSTSGASSGSNRTLHNFADVHVSVDVSSSKLEIIDASETFIELGGSETVGSSLASWVRGGKRFAKRLQRFANSLVNEEERLPENFGSLRLKTPIASCLAAGVVVVVEDVNLHAQVDPEDLQKSARIRLVLSGVQAAIHGGYRVDSNHRGPRTRTSL